MTFIDDTAAENSRIDALTGSSLAPGASFASDAAGLAELRAAWRQCDGIPTILSGREDGTAGGWGGIDIRTMLDGGKSGGRFSFHDVVLAPGAGLPAHYFNDIHALWWVIEGEAELRIGNVTDRVPAGGFGFAPPRTRQAVKNASAGLVRVVVGYGLAGLENAFAEAHAHWSSTADEQESVYTQILARYGFCFDAAVLANDALTNVACTRVEAKVQTFADLAGLRDTWSARQPLPRLLRTLPADIHHALPPEVNPPRLVARQLLCGDESAGYAMVSHGMLVPQHFAGAHHQPSEDEIFLVLEGQLELTCGAGTRVLGPGGFGFAPRNATHAFRNVGDGQARMVTINAPAGHERGFEMMMREHKSERFRDLLAAHGWRVHAPS
jgi:quercetin dioxygenase-like cupin family protein